jgi:hypothetical protein
VSNRQKIRLATVLVVVGVAATAHAATVAWLDLTRAQSAGVAGLTGTPLHAPTVASSPTEARALTAIVFADLSSGLCAIKRGQRLSQLSRGPSGTFETYDARAVTGHPVGPCRNAAALRGARERTIRVPGPNHYIRGLEVCTNTATGARLSSVRGVRLLLSEVRSGAIESVSQTEELELDGCEHWHPAVNCPAGSFATEVVPHHGGNAATTFYRGLELICAPLSDPGGEHEWVTGTGATPAATGRTRPLSPRVRRGR